MMRKLSGQITVEAAIVIPIILFTVAQLILFSFFMHDMVVAKAVAYDKGIEALSDGRVLDQVINQQLQKQNFFLMCPKVFVEKKHRKYVVYLSWGNKSENKWISSYIAGNKMSVMEFETDMKLSEMQVLKCVGDFVKNKGEHEYDIYGK